MSFCPARARPATVARLTRRAISETASKSPSEAIGSRPRSRQRPSRRGHGRPAAFPRRSWRRRAIARRRAAWLSKMMTRSVGVGHGCRLSGCLCRGAGASWRAGPCGLVSVVASAFRPLRAQARAPVRPSGAAKEKKKPGQTGNARRRRSDPAGLRASRQRMWRRGPRRFLKCGAQLERAARSRSCSRTG